MKKWGLVSAMLILTACGARSPLPDMQPGEVGRVVKVLDGDALILDTGQSVRLVAIEAPALRPRGREPDPYAVESARALEDMALGRQVQLYYPGLTRDRYDRALAHVVTIDGAGPKLWLNRAMIELGAARVRLYPDTAARGQEFLTLENDVRAARTGLWGKRAYAVQEAAGVLDERGFMLLKGRLGAELPVDPEERYRPACVRALQGAELRLEIRYDASTACGLPDGTDILVRGYVSNGAIDLTYPRHLEVIEHD